MERRRPEWQPFIPQQAIIPIPVAGTTSAGGTFTGQMMVHRFAVNHAPVVAEGTMTGQVVVAEAMVTGTVFDAKGAFVGNFLTGPVLSAVTARQVEHPRAAGAAMAPEGNCELLRLEATGLKLDVMGLAVTTTLPLGVEVSGAPGRPLGDMVCRTTEALEQPAPLAALLGELLKMLGGTGLQA
jgi:hypothetical protein